MASKGKSTAIPAFLALGAVVVSILCLGVSISQGAYFMSTLAEGTDQRLAMFAAVFALICGSQVLSQLTGIAIANRSPVFMVVFAVVTIFLIEAFSVSTSMTAFTSHIDRKQRNENTSSAEYNLALNAVNELQIQINDARSSMGSMPANWISRREDSQVRIERLSNKMERARNQLNLINKSSTATTFKGIEAATGLKPQHLAAGAGVLLSLLPFVCGGLCANIAAKRRISSEKKPQAAA